MLDTNVLVSALLNSFGAPGRVLDLVLSGSLTMVYDDRVLAEWREVLRREKFSFDPADVNALLDFFEYEGLKVVPPVLVVALRDPDDLPFLEVASASGAILVTGNLKHYPPANDLGVEVMDARTFLHRRADSS